MKDNNDNLENKLYFNKYKPEKKIGEGSFGKIYSCNLNLSLHMKRLILQLMNDLL